MHVFPATEGLSTADQSAAGSKTFQSLTAHLDGSLHEKQVLGVCHVDGQAVPGAEQQILLHRQVGMHYVILQQTGGGVDAAKSVAWLTQMSIHAISYNHGQKRRFASGFQHSCNTGHSNAACFC